MLKGITVTLYEKTQDGVDAFNHPQYIETPVTVADVLVAPATNDDVITSTDLYGKKAVFVLGIPKGDTHEWEDARIDFFGKSFRSFGPIVEGIEANVPTRWHKKIYVDRYE